jgi:hypothetical protein
MSSDPGRPYQPPPPPGDAPERRRYGLWVVAVALVVGGCLGAVAVVATDGGDHPDESEWVRRDDIRGILGELSEWEYVEEGDTGVPLDDFCDAVRERGEVNDCFVVDGRAYFHEAG